MPLGPLASQSPPAPPRDRLAIRVAVDTVRGAEEGVPALLALLRRFEADATFLFALGPDRSGRALGRFLGRSRPRIGPVARYGVAGLVRGTLLPAPLIGERGEAALRAVADAGFEVGIRSWCPHDWTRRAAGAASDWTTDRMQRAHDRFVQILGRPPRVHAACGWQMNRHAFRMTQRLGFDYCSDTRGFRPYVPVLAAEIVACPQIPTTLPTFDELLSDPAASLDDLDQRMLNAMDAPAPEGHVLALDADFEGLALLGVLERLLVGLVERGRRPMSLAQYVADLASADLPRHAVEPGSVQGHAGPLAMQFREFLA